MTTEFLILIPLGVFIGLLIGVVIDIFTGKVGLIGLKSNRKKAVGTLQIVESEGEDPYIFLSLETDISSFKKEQTIVLNVCCKQVPHK